ncbi:MAG: tryptophan 2,3-dioxygenase family protein [Gemmatimonadota bacterium]|nr:tryptophan 2,3-dioxygenase family protein [Gemmatimonadota bacterium]
MELTYASYLKLDDLLKLQVPRSNPVEHDEMLFIVVHQTYELWFVVLLQELDKVKKDLSENRVFDAIHTFKRMRTVMKTLVGQLDVLETMTPMSFLAFRDRLEKASGFQSMQFRELEFALGCKRESVLEYYGKDTPGYDRVVARLSERSVVDHFYDFLELNGVEIPDEIKTKEITEPTKPHDQIQDGVLKILREQGELGILCELMVDFDEGLQEWRYRHVKLVERTIGNKEGTGGSLGVEFLKKSLFQPIFPDLWAVRHKL